MNRPRSRAETGIPREAVVAIDRGEPIGWRTHRHVAASISSAASLRTIDRRVPPSPPRMTFRTARLSESQGCSDCAAVSPTGSSRSRSALGRRRRARMRHRPASRSRSHQPADAYTSSAQEQVRKGPTAAPWSWAPDTPPPRPRLPTVSTEALLHPGNAIPSRPGQSGRPIRSAIDHVVTAITRSTR